MQALLDILVGLLGVVAAGFTLAVLGGVLIGAGHRVWLAGLPIVVWELLSFVWMTCVAVLILALLTAWFASYFGWRDVVSFADVIFGRAFWPALIWAPIWAWGSLRWGRGYDAG